ncbi:MAG: hypothetical protein NWE98_12180 [Candidatus Bathyarchaeota archaeon]|nr:hypothetical protein [Candidatus Bathyarchaeota archaeon]
MADDSGQKGSKTSSSLFEQMFNLLSEVTGEQPNLKINIKNLKLNLSSQPKEWGQLFESANVTVSANDMSLIKVAVEEKTINIDVENKKFLKGLIKIGRNFTKQQSPKKEGKQKSRSALNTARTVAETLEKNGITMTISYKGKLVATLGAEAHSTLLQLVMKTRAIALNSPLQALRMII